MMSRRQRTLLEDDSSNVVGYITVYKFGTKFISAQKSSYVRRNPLSLRSTENIDRPILISEIFKLLHLHRRNSQALGQRRKLLRKLGDESENYHFHKTCCPAWIHRALYRAIRLCHDMKICESRLYPIGELFLELFMCCGDTYALYSPILDNNLAYLCHASSDILYPLKDQRNVHSSFEYYLRHVCNSRCSQGIDYVNQEIGHHSGVLPLTAAVHKRDPVLVLTLLRYGADPYSIVRQEESDSNIHITLRNPIQHAIDDLNGLFLFKNTAFSDSVCAKLAVEEEKVWTCLTYIRRAVRGIDFTSCTHVITTSDYDSDEEEAEKKKPTTPPSPKYNLLPKLANKIDLTFFKETSSLKQLCRCVIRDSLKANWRKIGNIPRAVNQLPIPAPLKQYLDLQTD